MRVRWSTGAEKQRDEATLRQPSFPKLRQLNKQILEALELIEQFPETAKMYPAYNREDFRLLVVGEYRMSYLILDDEIIVVSFVHGRSDVAHD